MKVKWSLIEESVILPHKLTAHGLGTRGVHDHVKKFTL